MGCFGEVSITNWEKSILCFLVGGIMEKCIVCSLIVSGCLVMAAWGQPCPAVPTPPGTGFDGVPTPDSDAAVLLAHTLNTSTVGSVGSATTNISISVPAGTTRLCVYGFDFDIVNNLPGGTFWDVSPVGHDETIFAFYADPGLTGDTSNFLGQFFSDHPVLLSSDGVWRKVVDSGNFASAQDADGNHNYLLQVTWESELQDVNEANRFMVATPDPGEVKVLDGTIAGLVGQKTIPAFPEANFPGMVTNFIGDYTSTRVIDELNVCHVDLWEADFDYADDTDNAFTTPTDPPFPSDGGVAEGVNLGKPPDDNANPGGDFNNNLGDVFYTLRVDALALASNTDPSGDREWERYTLCSALSGGPGCAAPPSAARKRFPPSRVRLCHWILRIGIRATPSFSVSMSRNRRTCAGRT